MPTGSLVEAEIAAGGISVQLVSHRWPSPVETVFAEAYQEHVVALQQQPPQANSRGRFDGALDHSFGEIGRLLAIPAGRSLHVCATGGVVRAIRCAFTPESYRRAGGRRAMDDLPSALALDIRNQRIAQTLRRMAEEALAPGFAGAALIEGLGLTLMADLARHLDAGADHRGQKQGGIPPRILRMLLEQIEESETPPTVSALAETAGLSRRHLNRVFRETTGRAVHDVIEESRFRRAIALLDDSNLILKDIAFRLGFAHQCSFTTAFRRLAGESPLAYRRRMKIGA
jgi:AraC family transcriptional regulator